jgi:hypothetical protein
MDADGQEQEDDERREARPRPGRKVGLNTSHFEVPPAARFW